MIPRIDLSEITEGYFQAEVARICRLKPTAQPVIILGINGAWWFICERKYYEDRMAMS